MPFFQTASLGSPGAGQLPDGDVINHFHGVRFLVEGQGVLRTTLYSKSNAKNQILKTINMVSSTERFEHLLANFVSPQCSVRVETTDMDEIFSITRITLYHKFYGAEYPG